jgi:23S rRNA (guanine745-N1)-methyltransferase
VRGCGLPLERRERAFTCSAGHAFDIARSGYVNLLQPQDRRSSQAGDSKATVDARAALDRAGVGRALIVAVIDSIAALRLPPDPIVLDLGAGSGEMLGKAWTGLSIAGIGIDLSVAAVELASRRYPALTWVVANADRKLPIRDRSVDVVLSVHGRKNPSESARVLKETGRLIVALPAPDDLIELRALVHGHGLERDRVEAMLEEHATDFELIERFQVRDQRQLERDALVNLLQGTYRGARFTAWMKVAALEPMAVTLSSDVCVLKGRTGR